MNIINDFLEEKRYLLNTIKYLKSGMDNQDAKINDPFISGRDRARIKRIESLEKEIQEAKHFFENQDGIKIFELSHILDNAGSSAIALFNSVRPIEKDSAGYFVWEAFACNEGNLVAKKRRIYFQSKVEGYEI